MKLMEVYNSVVFQTADSDIISSVIGTIPCRESMYMYWHTCYWLWRCSKKCIQWVNTLTGWVNNKFKLCMQKGWVHWCMDWVQMNPHAPLATPLLGLQHSDRGIDGLRLCPATRLGLFLMICLCASLMTSKSYAGSSDFRICEVKFDLYLSSNFLYSLTKLSSPTTIRLVPNMLA